jgi:hypothetical protein
MRLFCHLVFLGGDMAQLVVEGFGERGEELDRVSHSKHASLAATYLCFARVALVAGDADVVEQAVQLPDDGRDLLG